MKGLTLYFDEIERSIDRLTDEELGYVMRAVVKSAKDNKIPKFRDERIDIIADPLKNCIQKGINKSLKLSDNGKKGGAPIGNKNAIK